MKNCRRRIQKQRDDRDVARTPTRNAHQSVASQSSSQSNREDTNQRCPQENNSLTTSYVQTSINVADRSHITPENTISSATKTGGFSSFITEAELSIPENPTSVKKITVLRDTGASQSLLLRDSMDNSSRTDTGNVSIIQGVGSNPYLIPLHRFHLNHHLVKGEVILGVIDKIPVPG